MSVLPLMLAVAGCAQRDRILRVENQPPEIVLDPVTPPGKTDQGPVRGVGMLHLQAARPEHEAPRLTVTAPYLTFTQPRGGLPGDEVFIEVPAGEPIGLTFRALGLTGTGTIEYRWALDPRRLVKDESPRGRSELRHWRPWSAGETQATVGPFEGGSEHVVVIEARDELHVRSRVTVRVLAVAFTIERDLLIVDDTRLFPDMVSGTGIAPPVGPWPTASELDTFLFARGGVPWRGAPGGTQSPPGLFSGYDFDTLGTRAGLEPPDVPLRVLKRYRHVIWITDAASARMTAPGTDPIGPITALRSMSSPGRLNSLAAYIDGGGKAWLLGGGIATASLMPWNDSRNDAGGLSWSNALGELVPGRMMYDQVHWRSEIRTATTSGFVTRLTGRLAAAPGLPALLRAKSAATDPFPPGRPGQPSSVFYRTTFDVEYLDQHNFIIERGESTLDTLYQFVSSALPPMAPLRVNMTHYHGARSAPVTFSGFDIWSFARADCRALVDFVLGDVWGLTRTAPAAAIVQAVPRR